MAKFLFNLPDDQLQRLKEQSQNTGTSVSQLIRHSIGILLGDLVPCAAMLSGGAVISGYVPIVNRY